MYKRSVRTQLTLDKVQLCPWDIYYLPRVAPSCISLSSLYGHIQCWYAQLIHLSMQVCACRESKQCMEVYILTWSFLIRMSFCGVDDVCVLFVSVYGHISEPVADFQCNHILLLLHATEQWLIKQRLFLLWGYWTRRPLSYKHDIMSTEHKSCSSAVHSCTSPVLKWPRDKGSNS